MHAPVEDLADIVAGVARLHGLDRATLRAPAKVR